MTAGGQLFELVSPTITSNGFVASNCAGSLMFTGSASGTNSVTLTATQTGLAIGVQGAAFALTGAVAQDEKSMSGTWTLTQAGQKCQMNQPSGTWSAALLTPVNGTWTGTMASGTNAALAVSATLSENTDQTSVNMGDVTGTVTMSGSTCVSGTVALDGSSFHLGQQLLMTTSPDSNGVTVLFSGQVDPGAKTTVASPNGQNYVAQIKGGTCNGQQFFGVLKNQ